MAETLVPDTSVLVDGRISGLVANEYKGARVLVPLAALAELEAQANRGLETGFAGLQELQDLHKLDCTVEMVGTRPDSASVRHAASGAIDALIRDAAVEHQALFLTSDRVQAHAAAAQGLRHHYVPPIVGDEPDLSNLGISAFFSPETMSVHLKADCAPMIKTGTPAGVTFAPFSTTVTPHPEVRKLALECVEFAKRDYSSFVEMEKNGCTVVQLGPMRVTIAQPPFSDGLEITAVRPVFKATLDDYDVPEAIMERIEGHARGVFVAGPPGSGKSTFVAAIGDHLHGLNRAVKTMEQPRDLQVPKDVTQYGALEGDMANTGEVMLLVRPDHVLYDEVRTTNDFRTFADMRLAGIGLFGVTHANRAIDAVQRLIGRVDLGMIPQIVDTIIFIDKGTIGSILELRFTVKVPAGMMSDDLARPVVVVHDILRHVDTHELYSFGEQIVVMPLEGDEGTGYGASTPTPKVSAEQVERTLARFAEGRMEVTVRGNRATVYVDDYAVPQLIGKGGRTVQGLERKLGIKLDVKSFAGHPGPKTPQTPMIKKTGNNVFLMLDASAGGHDWRVEAEGAIVGEARASNNGRLRFKTASPEGKAILAAQKAGLDVTCDRL